MSERSTRAAIALALAGAAARLLPLQWLHPLNWDEIELYRAARWIAEGRVPFRDFWEHHLPLAWFVYAPFTRLTNSPGADAILTLRWAQVPVWIASFWLLNVFMRRAELPRFARWSASAIAICSSMLMTSGVEVRLDSVASAFYLAGLVLWQRASKRAMFGAGVMFCLAGLANMRLGPMLVVTVLLLRVIGERRWKNESRANWLILGGITTAGVAMLYFLGTHSMQPMLHAILYENRVGDQYAPNLGAIFIHRLLIPFGIRTMATDRLFEWAAVDVGGILVLLIGLVGLVRALLRWRAPDDLFVLAVCQVANLGVIAAMKFIYNYHFQIVVLMMVPLMALAMASIRARAVIVAMVVAAFCVSAFASIFRGKELDLAYQDFLMREVDARTSSGDRVFAGIPWALRREPAYRFWFLPDMTRRLVMRGDAQPYALADIVRNPPAAVVADQYSLVWMSRVQPELAPYFVRHYIPVWRNLAVPGLSARVNPLQTVDWIVPRDGTYRVFASQEIGRHPWFTAPLTISSYEQNDASRNVLALPAPAAHPELDWAIDEHLANVGSAVALRKGQHVTMRSRAMRTLGVILLPGDDTVLFRQPPRGATLEAATTRVTHIPQFGVHFQR